MRPGAKRPLGLGASALLSAVLLAAAARRARLEPMLVHGESMLPALAPGQRIAVGPVRRAPRRGDVVVVRRPEREVVKRLVGLPGERVRLAGGRLEIDGRHVPEPWAVARPRLDANGPPGPLDPDGTVELDLRLGADQLVVLGDCRDRSTDSRSFGPVRRNDLIAIVRFAYWPPRRMRPPK